MNHFLPCTCSTQLVHSYRRRCEKACKKSKNNENQSAEILASHRGRLFQTGVNPEPAISTTNNSRQYHTHATCTAAHERSSQASRGMLRKHTWDVHIEYPRKCECRVSSPSLGREGPQFSKEHLKRRFKMILKFQISKVPADL